MMNTKLRDKIFVLMNGFIVLTGTIATVVITEGFFYYSFERIPVYIAIATETLIRQMFL